MRPVHHFNRLVVTHDRDVEQGLEDPELRGEEPVQRRLRGVREVADRLDGGRCISALEEEGPSRLDDGGPGTAGKWLPGGPLTGPRRLELSILRCEGATL